MAFSIQTNVSSMQAQENLRVNQDFQSRTIGRLTSGFRINSSGDDAAGLSVANQFRSSVTELTQGVRNANDGISQLQIIDGGLNNVSKILDRLKTLATQSASTTFTGDRSTLNDEFQSLLGEIDRQAKGIKLDSAGAFATKMNVYIGGGAASNATSATAQVSVDLSGSAVDAGSLGISNTSVLGGGVGFSGTLTNARLDNPAAVFSASQNFTVRYIDSNGVAQSATVGYTGSATQTGAKVVSDINAALKSNNVDGITAQIGSNGQLQFVGSGSFTVSTTAADNAAVDNAGNSAVTLVNTGRHHQETSGFAAYTAGGGSAAIDQLLFTDAKTGKTVSITLDDSNADTQSNAVNALNTAFKAAGVSITALATGSEISFQSSSDFSVALAAHTAAAGGGTGSIVGTTLGTVGSTSIDTQASATGAALAAVDAIASAVSKLGLVQGKIGTGQNQLGYAIQLAQSQISNFSAAESRIRDADVAAEAANLTKAQVLQQASMAAMAQANSAPQAVLALLRG
jgi:flagellin